MKTIKIREVFFASIVFVSLFLPEASYAICRDLVPSDAYYNSWKSCCDLDTTIGHSKWIHRTNPQKNDTFAGSCKSWGVQEIVKEPVCRNLIQGDNYYATWRRCCDEGKGSRWWKRFGGDTNGEFYENDCRHYGIDP